MDEMSDLEMVKRCAEAMGFRVVDDFADLSPPVSGVEVVCDFVGVKNAYRQRYDPLHDDAQAMALVKRFRLEHQWTLNQTWIVNYWNDNELHAEHADLNRAIVECCARMMVSRTLPAPDMLG